MRKVFIIGNGFDISHELQTSYYYFRNFLIDKYKVNFEDSTTIPYASMMPKGELVISDQESAQFIAKSIEEVEGDEWNEFEKALGLLDFDSFYDDVTLLMDKEDDNFFRDQLNAIEDAAPNIPIAFEKLSRLFTEWVESIDFSKLRPKPSLLKITDDETGFISFNYTDTLEKTYNVDRENIIYLHGKAMSDEALVFGHGGNIDKLKIEEYLEKDEYDFDNVYEDTFDLIDDYKDQSDLILDLKKDTTSVLNRFKFDIECMLSDCDEVYFYGFSFANVDLVYVEFIVTIIKRNSVHIYLNDWSRNESMNQIKILRMLGFKGKISLINF